MRVRPLSTCTMRRSLVRALRSSVPVPCPRVERRPMTAGLTFRDATDADVDALVALIESAYRGDSSRAGWTTEADILEGQRTDPQGVLAVIESTAGRLLVFER